MLGAIKDASPLDIGAMAAGLFLLYHVHQYLTVGAARRKIIAQNGCKPPNKYPLSGPYGLRLLLQVLKRAKEGTILNGMRERHLSYGNTLSIVFMGENGQYIPIYTHSLDAKTYLFAGCSHHDLRARKRKDGAVP